MGIPSSNVAVAFGRQSAAGVGAPPTYGVGLESGKPWDEKIDQGEIPLTSAFPGFSEVERRSVKPGLIIPTLAYARLAGLFLYQLLGADVVTGAGPNYTHTLTPANEPLPWVGAAARYGAEYAALLDLKVDQLEFKWAGPGKVDMTATLAGKTIWTNQGSRVFADGATTSGSPNITSPALGLLTQADVGRPITGAGIPASTVLGTVTPAVSPATNSAATLATTAGVPVNATATASGVTLTLGSLAAFNDEAGQPYFSGAGATFLMDAASTVPVAAKCQAGSIILKRNADSVILAASQMPDDIVTGQLEVLYSLTLVPNDLTQWYKVETGSGTGLTPSGTPPIGSADVTFAYDVNTSLRIFSNRVTFLADMPDAKPKGGSAIVTFAGTAFRPTGGNIVSAVVKNSVAAY
jgi:hypothetical protein